MEEIKKQKLKNKKVKRKRLGGGIKGKIFRMIDKLERNKIK